jgi:hypothetical protein
MTGMYAFMQTCGPELTSDQVDAAGMNCLADEFQERSCTANSGTAAAVGLLHCD